MNDIREKVLNMSKTLKVEKIASFLNTTPENIQKILDGEKINVSEIQNERQSIVQVTTNVTVHRQKVIAVWRAKGGVGATITAINLAKMVSDNMRTLLVCLNFSQGGSDIIQYLDLPYCALSSQAIKETLIHTTEIKNNFFVMSPVTRLDQEITPDDIKNLILKAREDFDCVILDLPASMDQITLEAVRSCSTIVFILQSKQQEGQRIAKLAHHFNTKQLIYVCNQGLKEKDCQSFLPSDIKRVVEIPLDKTIKERVEKQTPFLPPKSPFYQAIENIHNNIFQELAQGDKKDNKFARVSYQLRKLRRNVGAKIYDLRIYDLAKESFYVVTLSSIFLAALYSMNIKVAVIVVNFLSNKLNAFL